MKTISVKKFSDYTSDSAVSLIYVIFKENVKYVVYSIDKLKPLAIAMYILYETTYYLAWRFKF